MLVFECVFITVHHVCSSQDQLASRHIMVGRPGFNLVELWVELKVLHKCSQLIYEYNVPLDAVYCVQKVFELARSARTVPRVALEMVQQLNSTANRRTWSNDHDTIQVVCRSPPVLQTKANTAPFRLPRRSCT